MPCAHGSGGLQLFTYEQGVWHVRCLCCGEDHPSEAPGFPVQAGQAACTAFLRHAQRRFADAAASFRQAAEISGDARFLFAALLCRYGVTWCGDEYQPTFGVFPLPVGSMRASAECQAVEQAAEQLGSAVALGMSGVLAQLEEILACIRRQEGLSGCDVFLCYRRTSATVRSALHLYRDLTDSGLRVFCADVTTRGKTQEQFEGEVYHALNTAEYLVLLPGEGTDALTPWLRNELARAAALPGNRLICTRDGLHERLGEHLPPEEIRSRLLAAAPESAPDRLYERALLALRSGAAQQSAALLHRASAKGCLSARLLAAELYGEGLVLPVDPERSQAFRQLAGEPSERCRQQVNDDLTALEEALGVARRKLRLCLVADVSSAGFAASRLLARGLIAALNADRRLARAELCIVGYDLHARVLEEPKPLVQYGLPEAAARSLRTEDGDAAYAAKGLHCAAELLYRHANGSEGEPAVILLRPCLTADADSALLAAQLMLESVARPEAVLELCSADQIEDRIARLRHLAW